MRLVNGASGAPVLALAEPADSSAAKKPVHGRSSGTRRPSGILVPRSQRSRSALSRGGNVQVRQNVSLGNHNTGCSSCSPTTVGANSEFATHGTGSRSQWTPDLAALACLIRAADSSARDYDCLLRGLSLWSE